MLFSLHMKHIFKELKNNNTYYNFSKKQKEKNMTKKKTLNFESRKDVFLNIYSGIGRKG